MEEPTRRENMQDNQDSRRTTLETGLDSVYKMSCLNRQRTAVKEISIMTATVSQITLVKSERSWRMSTLTVFWSSGNIFVFSPPVILRSRLLRQASQLPSSFFENAASRSAFNGLLLRYQLFKFWWSIYFDDRRGALFHMKHCVTTKIRFFHHDGA